MELPFNFSGLNLSDFPSAKLKIDQLYVEWLSIEGNSFISDLIHEFQEHGFDETANFETHRNSLNHGLPRSPTKKSPKKRSQSEMLNYNFSTRMATESTETPKDDVPRSFDSISNLNPQPLKDSPQPEAKQIDPPLEDSSSSQPPIKSSSRRRSNFDRIPVFYNSPKTHPPISSLNSFIEDQVLGVGPKEVTPPPNTQFNPHPRLRGPLEDKLSARQAEIEGFFKPHKDGIPVEKFVHITKRFVGIPSFFNLPLCIRINQLYPDLSSSSSSSFNTNNNNNNNNNHNIKVKLSSFLKFWEEEVEPFDRVERFFRLIKQPSETHILKENFDPFLTQLLRFHPGLDFLENHEEFQKKYALTVITRIFQKVNTSGSGRISLREVRNSNLFDEFMHVDEETDINKVIEYFSYEHFYVLYCKFFELDADKDSRLSRDDLLKYGDHTLSDAIIDRVFQVGLRPFSDGKEGAERAGEIGRDDLTNKTNPSKEGGGGGGGGVGMTYSDFIYFMLAEEDKGNDWSLKYWFRCCDLDGDGRLNMDEMRFFYRSQIHRLTSLGHEMISFQDVLCQMLDLLHPPDPLSLSLQDFLQPDKKHMSGTLFDVLFNLHKFLRFETRDPFQEKMKREDGFASDWDRYAHFEYMRLAAEEEGGGSGGGDVYDGGMELDRGQGGGGGELDLGEWEFEDEDEDDEFQGKRK